MMARRGIAPDHMIAQRRRDEDLRAGYQQKVQRERGEKLFADWENTTHARIEASQKLLEMDQMQARRHQDLEDRRERLAALLAAEQEEYEAALEGLRETQDQRRDRMAAKALQLREQREQQRREVAEQKMRQAFVANCDVLRDAVSRTTTLQVAADRKQQLLWLEERKQREQEDNRFFDEMWEQDRLKKIQRAKEDLERVHAMNAQLRADLGAQNAAYQALKEQELELKAEEDRIYREQLQLQLEMDAQKERERKAEKIALGRRNKEYNLAMRTAKEAEARREKEEDMRLLNELIEKIRFEEEQDQELKRHNRQEARKYMEALRAQMGQDADNEAYMEKLWQQENDKEWAKREAVWKRDQEARDNLLREVFEERKLQLDLKRQAWEDKARKQQEERRRLLEEMEALTLIEKERQNQRRQAAVEAKDEIKEQIVAKASRRDDSARAKLLERELAEAAEREYRAKVMSELSAVEAQRPQQFKQYRLTSNRPF
eukprot:TRINITY_DN4497_c0_g1_i1.p1 TRINITY_DN4497_c0_g1~~TRINITY_DN4497_c0_g1_i1.p1  ORF type:complete len:490 (+),score=166.96 TRINITY_DN4497_c0_g1_i1:91-1560(+)